MKHNLAIDSPETRAKAKKLYEHEVAHLAQTAVWTATAIPINLATQKLVFRVKESPAHLLEAKGIGSVITSGLVMGTRSQMPDTAGKYDAWMTQHVINPATSSINNLLGVDAEGVERAAKRAGHSHGTTHLHTKPNTNIITKGIEAKTVTQPEHALST